MGERAIDTSEPVTECSGAAVYPLPTRLDTTTSKRVSLYLRAAEGATTDEMKDALGVGKLTLYPSLRRLTSTDLVRRAGATYLVRERAEGAR